MSGFCAFEFIPHSYKKTNLYFHSKLGYNEFYSRRNDKTGTSMVELNIGLKKTLRLPVQIYIQSGILFTQHTIFIPLRLGVELQ